LFYKDFMRNRNTEYLINDFVVFYYFGYVGNFIFEET
jgi:hypothetical protein